MCVGIYAVIYLINNLFSYKQLYEYFLQLFLPVAQSDLYVRFRYQGLPGDLINAGPEKLTC